MGCAFNQCCWSEANDESICEHILGGAFINETTIENKECYIWQFGDEDGVCVGEGHGCLFTRDDPGSLAFSVDFLFGTGYLRPNLSAAQHRDAENRIADIRSWRGEKDFVGTFVESLELQAAGCVDNLFDHACWGSEVGHPCQCYHNPPSDCAPNAPSTPSVGIIKQIAIYIHDGWPFQAGLNGTGKRAQIRARKWDTDPVVNLTLQDSRHGQTKFVTTAKSWKIVGETLCPNALVQCQAFIPGDSDCLDCSSARNCDQSGNCEPSQTHYFGGSGDVEANLFSRMEFTGWDPTIRGDTDEVRLYNEVLQTVQEREFPVVCGFPGQTMLFDRIDDHMGTEGNLGIGVYSREWMASKEVIDDSGNCHAEFDIDAAIKVKDLTGVKTKWGGYAVDAELVMTHVEVLAHCHLHKTSPSIFLERRNVTPYVVLRIRVRLGVRATVVSGGDEVYVYYPILPSGEASNFPSVTPLGNEIDYGFRIRPIVEWRGRLSNLSTPASEPVEYYVASPHPGIPVVGGFGCDHIRDALDAHEIVIPPLPSDAKGAEPNLWYTGDVRFKFFGGI